MSVPRLRLEESDPSRSFGEPDRWTVIRPDRTRPTRRTFVWWWLVLGAVGLAAAAIAGGAAWFDHLERAMDRPFAPGGEVREVEVEQGESLRDVQARLVAAGLLPEDSSLALWGRLTGEDRRIRYGLYALSPAQSAREILETLVAGRTLKLQVTIPEGLDLAAILERLAGGLRVSGESLAVAAADPAWIASLGVPVSRLEGYLFPETYAFEHGTRPREALGHMVGTLWTVLDEGRRSRAAALGLGVHELLTLASIIQAEAALEEEMPRISAVYHNRLRQGILLQADPTVAYAAGRMGQRLLVKHLEVDSPYNTYRHKGLPPGPICSPGLAAIEAALHPLERCGDLYFVARGDGSHVFSRTLAEHNRARSRARRP